MFYVLDTERDIFANNIHYAPKTSWVSIKCPINRGHQRAGGREGPLRVILDENITDFMWTFIGEVVITDRVAKLFKEAGFTGYELEPVEVVNRQDITVWKFNVTGKGGKAQGLYLKYRCEACGLERYGGYENGIIFDEKEWDGSDFFEVDGWGVILITERVKDFIEKHGLTNVIIIPLNEFKVDPDI